MTFKDKIKGFAKKLAEKPVRNITALGLAGLITLTAVKDNVHFGSVTLHNPQENHYVWGLAPTTTIKEGSKNTNGNFYSAGIIYGKNKTENNVEVNDMKAYGLFGENNVGDNSKVNNMKLYGLIGGISNVGDNTEINGDIITKGIIANNPFSLGFGSNDVIGLKNYVHKIEKQQKNKDISENKK